MNYVGVYVLDGEKALVHRAPVGSPSHDIAPFPLPAGLIDDVKYMLAAGPALDHPVTIVTPRPPYDCLHRDDFVAAVEKAGWKTSHTDGGWFTCVDPAGRVIHIGVRSWAVNDDFIGNKVDPAVLVQRLREIADATGTHYRHNAGATMIAAIRESLADRRIRWMLKDDDHAEWWGAPGEIQDLRYKAGASREGEHRWDMRSAYLAAAAAVDLPALKLQHTGTDIVDVWNSVGYYRIKIPDRSVVTSLMRRDRQGTTWVCHPTLRYLKDRYALEIVDSWTNHPNHPGTRLLRPWAEKTRDAMADPWYDSIVPVLKLGYSQAIGLFNVKGGTIYRPDWRHMIIDQVRASMLRRIERVRQLLNIFPRAVDVDSIWYSTTEPDRVGEALGVGPNIGKMRYEGISQ